MKQKWIAWPLLVLLSLLLAATVSAAERKKITTAAKVIVLTPDDLQWKEGPAALGTTKMAVLEGNPKQAGFFVSRLKLPAGTKIQSHVHERVERVTVISGKIYLAMGDKQQNPKVLPAGSYFSIPPNTVHNAWVEEETVVQISTNGPWSFKPVQGTDRKGGGSTE